MARTIHHAPIARLAAAVPTATARAMVTEEAARAAATAAIAE